MTWFTPVSRPAVDTCNLCQVPDRNVSFSKGVHLLTVHKMICQLIAPPTLFKKGFTYLQQNKNNGYFVGRDEWLPRQQGTLWSEFYLIWGFGCFLIRDAGYEIHPHRAKISTWGHIPHVVHTPQGSYGALTHKQSAPKLVFLSPL